MITGRVGVWMVRAGSLVATAPATLEPAAAIGAAGGAIASGAVEATTWPAGTFKMVPARTLVGSAMPLTCCSCMNDTRCCLAMA